MANKTKNKTNKALIYALANNIHITCTTKVGKAPSAEFWEGPRLG